MSREPQISLEERMACAYAWIEDQVRVKLALPSVAG